jgi:hypothetical protein
MKTSRRGHLEGLGRDVRIILKWALRKVVFGKRNE